MICCCCYCRCCWIIHCWSKRGLQRKSEIKVLSSQQGFSDHLIALQSSPVAFLIGFIFIKALWLTTWYFLQFIICSLSFFPFYWSVSSVPHRRALIDLLHSYLPDDTYEIFSKKMCKMNKGDIYNVLHKLWYARYSQLFLGMVKIYWPCMNLRTKSYFINDKWKLSQGTNAGLYNLWEDFILLGKISFILP